MVAELEELIMWEVQAAPIGRYQTMCLEMLLIPLACADAFRADHDLARDGGVALPRLPRRCVEAATRGDRGTP